MTGVYGWDPCYQLLPYNMDPMGTGGALATGGSHEHGGMTSFMKSSPSINCKPPCFVALMPVLQCVTI